MCVCVFVCVCMYVWFVCRARPPSHALIDSLITQPSLASALGDAAQQCALCSKCPLSS